MVDHKGYSKIGALVELPSIYSSKSARENLIFQYINLGLKIDDSVDELLKLVSLDNTGKKKAGRFSLGMRQRLGIAMAMAGNPDMLILDEPINGLDPQGIIEIRDLLQRLNREKGITIIISSHILTELSKLATNFAFVEGGEVVKEVTTEDVENAGGVQSEFFSSDPAGLLRVLKEKGLDARIEEGTGIIRVKGVFNLTDVVMEASKQGVNIARVSTRETDLETYFINLVGGHGNV
ncbi:MAG: ATP-binding cassette domain-containing protein [Oscillospiraceae bacterium]|nr:ATP-binding cassette domain-containing protein [Oscillospiraceae bacterium]